MNNFSFFDGDWYSKHYPDVAKAGVDPKEHFEKHGRKEGRLSCFLPSLALRNNATHVKTMYQGMRHIYRNACQWWHSKEQSSLFVSFYDERKFPVPKTMISTSSSNVSGDVAFVGDFSEGRVSKDTVMFITSLIEVNKQVILYHVPLPNMRQGQLSNDFFDLLSAPNAEVCVFGMSVSVDCICVLSSDLHLEKSEELVTFSTKKLFVLNSEKQSIKYDGLLRLIPMNKPEKVQLINKLEALLEHLN